MHTCNMKSMRVGALKPAALAVIALAATLTACQTQPEPLDIPAADVETVAILPTDLGVPDSAIQDPGVTWLEQAPTIGRFPAAVAVFRVAAYLDPQAGSRFIRVADSPAQRRIYWNQILDPMPAVREVRLPSDVGVDPRGANYRDLLKKALDSHCRLALLYAAVDGSDADAEYIGVLWDATEFKPLAAFRAPIVLEDEIAMACAEEERTEKWLCLADFRALSDLRQYVRNTVWTIADEDQPPAQTKASPWREYHETSPWDYEVEQSIRRNNTLPPGKRQRWPH